MVDMDAYVKKCIKKPLIWHPKLLKDIFPVTREEKNKEPGIHAFKRSVTAKAAIMMPVELRRRGFVYKAISRIELPRKAHSTRDAEVNDSNTIRPTLLGGRDIIQLS